MDLDELEPRKKKPQLRDLQGMSIEELDAYIEELEAEIARTREMIKSKKSVRAGADSLFKR
ncbi:MAG: DUF1192 domain-containing protein [Alphaproteobacteria bacterium]|nr:DUF1192 domain-containing protein [Alphaproteobacteria bacterium]